MLFTDPIDAVPAFMTIRYVLTAQEFVTVKRSLITQTNILLIVDLSLA